MSSLKRILSLVVVFAMLLSVSVFADGPETPDEGEPAAVETASETAETVDLPAADAAIETAAAAVETANEVLETLEAIAPETTEETDTSSEAIEAAAEAGDLDALSAIVEAAAESAKADAETAKAAAETTQTAADALQEQVETGTFEYISDETEFDAVDEESGETYTTTGAELVETAKDVAEAAGEAAETAAAASENAANAADAAQYALENADEPATEEQQQIVDTAKAAAADAAEKSETAKAAAAEVEAVIETATATAEEAAEIVAKAADAAKDAAVAANNAAVAAKDAADTIAIIRNVDETHTEDEVSEARATVVEKVEKAVELAKVADEKAEIAKEAAARAKDVTLSGEEKAQAIKEAAAAAQEATVAANEAADAANEAAEAAYSLAEQKGWPFYGKVVTAKGVIVTARAQAGVFPKDTELTAEDVEAEVVENTEGAENISVVTAVDINFYLGGAAIQPDTSKGLVDVTIEDPNAKIADDAALTVGTIVDDVAETVEGATFEDGVAVFTTDHFTVYYTATVASEYVAEISAVKEGATVTAEGSGDGMRYYADSLQGAIDAAADGATVKLLKNIEINAMVRLSGIGTYIIDGDGHTISQGSTDLTGNGAICFGRCGLAYDGALNTSNYTIKNTKLTGFRSEIFRTEDCTLTIDGCTFTENTITQQVASSLSMLLFAHTKVVMKNCTVSKNQAERVIYYDDSNAGESVEIDNCLFEENTVSGAGVIQIGGTVVEPIEIKNSTFHLNTTNGAGNVAVVYCSGKAIITGNLFDTNTVTTNTSSSKEGVIVLGSGATDTAITGNAFVSNTLGTTAANYATIYTGANCTLSNNYWGDGQAPEVGSQKDIYNPNSKTITNTCFASAYTVRSSANGVDVTTHYVAKIGTTYYPTLAAAIAAVPADGTQTTITMVGDEAINFEDEYAITIPSLKKVELDLDGHWIRGFSSRTANSAMIWNLGTLIIKDSASEDNDDTTIGRLTRGADPVWIWDGTENYSNSYASNLIRNEGMLTVDGGYLYNYGSGSATYAIDNYSAGKVTINGGTIDAASASAIRMFCNNGGAVTVNDGVIGHYNSDSDYSYMGIQVMGGTNAGVTIHGGTIDGCYSVYSNGTGSSFVVIDGGTFRGYVGFGSNGPSEISISDGLFLEWVGTWGTQTDFITGGKFSSNPSAYVANNHVTIKSDGATPYEVVPGTMTATTEQVATCTEAGVKTGYYTMNGSYYTANSDDDEGTYSATSDATIPALGHSWGDVTYTWSADNSTVTAARTCTRNSAHIDTETVETTYAVATEATCETTGVGTCTASFTNAAFATQTKDVEIAATGHSWGTPEWTWTGYSAATATRTCENDGDHAEAAAATITSARTEPTYTSTGSIVYTATVTFEDETYTDTRTVILDMLYDSSNDDDTTTQTTQQTQPETPVVIEEEATPLAELPESLSEVTVAVVDAETGEEVEVAVSELPVTFVDVAEDSFARDAIAYVEALGLMNGTGSNEDGEATFSPTASTTGDMLATILYRATSGEETSGENWAEAATAWAADNNLAEGMGIEELSQLEVVSREQMVTVMYRVAEARGFDVAATNDLLKFTDAGDLSDYARAAMEWAVSIGLIKGTDVDKLSPNAEVTREQIALILMRFNEMTKDVV